MIKSKGAFRKYGGIVHGVDFDKVISSLPDGHAYNYVIVNDAGNRSLPYQTYLFSVVLKGISDQLEGHPSPYALYKYFEEMFAPLHTCIIDGRTFSWRDLKREKKSDVIDFVEKVGEYVQKHWGLEIVTESDVKLAENRDLYAEIYVNQEVDWGNFLSSRKNKNQFFHDGRNKEI